MQLLAPNGEYWRFTVAAIARAGIGSIDFNPGYSHAEVAQALLQHPSGASMIIYNCEIPIVRPRGQPFETLFQHSASSWQEREESTLQLFLTLRMSVAITVSLIILLAGFGIFNVLTMSVLAKIKRSQFCVRWGTGGSTLPPFLMARRADCRGRIAARLLAGRVNDLGVSHIPIRIRGLLYTDYFLVTWDWRHYVFATLLAILAVFHRELCPGAPRC